MTGAAANLTVRSIAIVGTGLLGASLGLALKARGFPGRIVGIVRREQTARLALDRGAIDAAATDCAAVRDCDLAVVAVPLGAFERIFQQIAPFEHDGLTVTDVGSTKTRVVRVAHETLRRPGRFVGSHPMAGSERQGPEAADADLFAGKPCILTPTDDTDAAAVRLVERLWSALGMKLLRMTPADHDRAAAAVSHLPHAAAAALVHAAADMGGFEVASTGFRDTTRLASSNPPMRSDIMAANRAFLLEALAVYGGKLDELRRLLEAADDAKLVSWLTEAQRVRDRWIDQKDG